MVRSVVSVVTACLLGACVMSIAFAQEQKRALTYKDCVEICDGSHDDLTDQQKKLLQTCVIRDLCPVYKAEPRVKFPRSLFAFFPRIKFPD